MAEDDSWHRSKGAAMPGGVKLRPGDTFTWTTGDDKRAGKTYTLHRTDRPYAHDLADAYNAQLTNPALHYIVTANGEVKLDYRDEWSRQHTEDMDRDYEAGRRAWIRAQHNPVSSDWSNQ